MKKGPISCADRTQVALTNSGFCQTPLLVSHVAHGGLLSRYTIRTGFRGYAMMKH